MFLDGLFSYVTIVTVQVAIISDLVTKSKTTAMKNNKISVRIFIGFFLGIILLSCKEQKNIEIKAGNEIQEITKTDMTDSDVFIENYFSGANLMKFILLENNGLSLTEEQQEILATWREENHSKIQEKMQQLAKLESDMKSLSIAGMKSEEISKKEYDAETLRKNIADTKFTCHSIVAKTLNSEQWEILVTGYEKNFPFIERPKMMDVIQHVNPVPNYMKVIESDSKMLGLSLEQESKFEAWRIENHPKIIEMANQIMSLEREIYEESLQKQEKDVLVKKVMHINQLRADIIKRKTNCRNMLMETLDDNQWEKLVKKIS